MKSVFGELAQRFRDEIEELDRTVERTRRVWDQAKSQTVDQDVYLDSVALNLHSFYSGLERLFELVIKHIDGKAVQGKNWHQELLEAVSQMTEGVRPALIHPDRVDDLDELRRFRHVVRNVYATNLLPNRMEGLLQSLPDLWAKLKVELLAFAKFLEQLDQAADSEL